MDVKSYYGYLSQMIACLGCAVGTGKASVVQCSPVGFKGRACPQAGLYRG